MRLSTLVILGLMAGTSPFCIAQTAPATQAMEAAESKDEGAKPAEASSVADPSLLAQGLIDKVSSAYAEVKTLMLTGKISLDFDAGGEIKQNTASFTASYQSPNQFRHEIKDDVLVVGTGEKIYAYLPGKNEYLSANAVKERGKTADLNQPIVQLLSQQNPVLLLAIAQDGITALTTGADSLRLADDVTLGDTAYRSITFDKNDRAYRVLVNPSTFYVRQIRIDRKKELEKRGLEDVKTVDVTFDYLTTTAGQDVPAEQFAWTPPRDATVAKEEPADDSAEAATGLEGKPAPAFKLTGIDGTNVELSDLKGSVVVLDFWATWCGPCVASLPHIDQINTDLSEKGLKVFAINLQEPKAAVQKFVLTKKLALPVLLDSDGATGKKYLANAIPETVIIGKDGVVKKVFVGFGGDEALRAAIQAELAK